MKKQLLSTLFSLLTLSAFATEIPPSLPKPEEPSSSIGTVYLSLGIGEKGKNPADGTLMPGFSFGYRRNDGPHGLDVALSHYTKQRFSGSRHYAYCFQFPKITYLYYLSPTNNNSFYAGGGLGLAVTGKSHGGTFAGLAPNLTAGYEMGRLGTVRTLLQLEVTQPALPIYSSLKKSYDPIVQFSVGGGF